MNVIKLYREKDVIESIRTAYYQGFESGKIECGDEAFDPKDYLPGYKHNLEIEEA
jgi:hypothetical protein